MLAASHSRHRLQPRQSLTFAASAVRSRSRITFLNCFKEGKFLSLGVRSFQSLQNEKRSRANDTTYACMRSLGLTSSLFINLHFIVIPCSY